MSAGWDHRCLPCCQVQWLILRPHLDFMCWQHLTQSIITLLLLLKCFLHLSFEIYSLLVFCWHHQPTSDQSALLHPFSIFQVFLGLVSECFHSSHWFSVPTAFICMLLPMKFMAIALGFSLVHPVSILHLSSILPLGVQNQLKVNIYKRQLLIFNPKPMYCIQVFPS